jgi:hypothetical protein
LLLCGSSLRQQLLLYLVSERESFERALLMHDALQTRVFDDHRCLVDK